ncbi:DsbA family oxidoreductase [Pseudohoeflea coraliihabitans]|uniref:DsbA family oxidoreductase n=1 Tax=Pseudohoeflea coraliihabitans TaxID=2860393 RepID=A0ABS6WTM5_9HYPH|nr:DsbA family oxidoreductase [Pseudohoeflea sp. DP4N28-3]MBW3098414.1 DsbA family oxidoreductase [Pseudohoeflea sp. DP4N28-3]
MSSTDTPAPGQAAAPLTVDVISDVMCPWCYIGKKRLETALERLDGELEVEVHWRPYQLDPSLPKEGKDRKRYLEDKFGGAARATQAYQAVRNAGAEEDIAFDFEAIAVAPNTIDAHRLIRWAGSQGPAAQARMVAILFRYYFEEGRNIGEDATLIEAASEGGLDPEIVRKLLADGADRDKVEGEIDVARQLGIEGVPCFIVAGKYALVGAQPAEQLVEALRRAAAAPEPASGTPQ